jgi:hypothetical protein
VPQAASIERHRPRAIFSAPRQLACLPVARLCPADGGHIRPAARSLLVSVAASALAAGVVFLLASDGLGTWNGHAVSVRPSATPEPATFRVLIVGEDGRAIERDWPADLVLSLGLPVDDMALPPATIPEAAARTTKSRFALHTIVRAAGSEEWQVVPTTSPRSLGVAVLVGFVVLFLRNMMVSGSPFALTAQGSWQPPAALPKPGTPVAQKQRISKQGPPPAGPRTGRGRR